MINKYNITISDINKSKFDVNKLLKLFDCGYSIQWNKASEFLLIACGTKIRGGMYNDTAEDSFYLKLYKNGDVNITFTSYGDACGYVFEHFGTEIDNKADQEIQDKALELITWLIDEGVIILP